MVFRGPFAASSRVLSRLRSTQFLRLGENGAIEGAIPFSGRAQFVESSGLGLCTPIQRAVCCPTGARSHGIRRVLLHLWDGCRADLRDRRIPGRRWDRCRSSRRLPALHYLADVCRHGFRRRDAERGMVLHDLLLSGHRKRVCARDLAHWGTPVATPPYLAAHGRARSADGRRLTIS